MHSKCLKFPQMSGLHRCSSNTMQGVFGFPNGMAFLCTACCYLQGAQTPFCKLWDAPSTNGFHKKKVFCTLFLRGCSHITSAGRGGGRQMLTKADEGGRGGRPNADNCWQGGGWGQKNFQQWEFRGSKIVDSEKNWCKFYLKHWAKPNYMQIGPQQMNIAHVVISKSLR